MENFTFVNGSINLMTEAEAESYFRNAFISEEDGALIEHGMLVDSTQFLQLGAFSYAQVAASAIKKLTDEWSKQAGVSLEIGSIFDVYTAQSVAYGKHLDKVMRGLDSDSLITAAQVFTGSYLRSREQLQINSELMTDKSGREYYEVLRRFQFVSSNTPSPWYSHNTKNEVKRRFRLYKSGNTFYTMKNGSKTVVKLGKTSEMDNVINYIRAKGYVDNYVQAINSPEISSKVVEIADNQQLVFLTVMQVLKPQLEAEYNTAVAEAQAQA
jgi:hypothetical protein